MTGVIPTDPEMKHHEPKNLATQLNGLVITLNKCVVMMEKMPKPERDDVVSAKEVKQTIAEARKTIEAWAKYTQEK